MQHDACGAEKRPMVTVGTETTKHGLLNGHLYPAKKQKSQVAENRVRIILCVCPTDKHQSQNNNR